MNRLNLFLQSIVTEKAITRLICLACGEYINDDKFVTIRDPHGVIIYLHSKGKCERRQNQLEEVRERWLSMREHVNNGKNLALFFNIPASFS